MALVGAILAALATLSPAGLPAAMADPTPAPLARPAPPSPGADFAALAGSWRGEAWVQFGPNRYTFIQTERVAPHLGGAILIVEGRAEDTADPRASLFSAFAVLAWNPAVSAYEFRAYSGGRVGTFPARRTDDGALVWEMEGRDGARTRYVHRVVDGHWIGRGETSRDGVVWTEMFGMDLTRTGPATFEPAP
jgi:hypothetical protein